VADNSTGVHEPRPYECPDISATKWQGRGSSTPDRDGFS